MDDVCSSQWHRSLVCGQGCSGKWNNRSGTYITLFALDPHLLNEVSHIFLPKFRIIILLIILHEQGYSLNAFTLEGKQLPLIYDAASPYVSLKLLFCTRKFLSEIIAIIIKK